MCLPADNGKGLVIQLGPREILILSRELPQPGALIVLVLSIFVLLYICKVLSSDL